MSTTKPSTAKAIQAKNKKTDDLARRVWKTLCPILPKDSPPQYTALATKLYAGLENEVEKVTECDRRVLESLVEKDGPSLNQVSKPLFEVLLKVRGFARACKPAEKDGETKDCQGMPLVYEELDLNDL